MTWLWPACILMGVFVATFVPYALAVRTFEAEHASSDAESPAFDDAALLGPVSAWVAEGEARAVREWEAKHGTATNPSDKWATLYHIEQDAYHDVPNNPAVIADFGTRGWIPRDRP